MAHCGWFEGCWPELLLRYGSLSLFCNIVLPNIRLVSGSPDLNWLPGTGIGSGPMLPSTSRKVFIFFMIVGCGQSLMLQGVHLISWVVLSLLKMCVPCMAVIFTSTSMTSTGNLHLKKPYRKLHSGWSKHTMSYLK